MEGEDETAPPPAPDNEEGVSNEQEGQGTQQMSELMDVDLNKLLDYHISFDNLTHVIGSLIKVAKAHDDKIKTREKENEDLKKEIEELKATANENENKINEQASQLSEHDQKQKDLEDSLNAIDVDSLDKRIQALEDAKGQEGIEKRIQAVEEVSSEQKGSGEGKTAGGNHLDEIENRIKQLEDSDLPQWMDSAENRLTDIENKVNSNIGKIEKLEDDVDKLPSSEELTAMLSSNQGSSEGDGGGAPNYDTMMKLNQMEKSLARLSDALSECASKEDVESLRGQKSIRAESSQGQPKDAEDLEGLKDSLVGLQRQIDELRDKFATSGGLLSEEEYSKNNETGDSEHENEQQVSSGDIQKLRRELSRGLKNLSGRINDVEEASKEEDQNIRQSLSRDITHNRNQLEQFSQQFDGICSAIRQLQDENEKILSPFSFLVKTTGVHSGLPMNELESMEKQAVENFEQSSGSRSATHDSLNDPKKDNQRNANIYALKKLTEELARNANPKADAGDFKSLRAYLNSVEDQLQSNRNKSPDEKSEQSIEPKASSHDLPSAKLSERVSLCEEDIERHRRAIQRLKHDLKETKSELDNKLDKSTLDDFAKQMETKADNDDLLSVTRTVQDLLQRRPRRKVTSESKHEHQDWESENAAAAHRKLLPGYKCLVCDRPLQEYKHTEPKYVPKDTLPVYQKDSDFSFHRFHRPVTAVSRSRSRSPSPQRSSRSRPSSADPHSNDPFLQERTVGGKYTHDDAHSPEVKRLPNGQIIRRASQSESQDGVARPPSSSRRSKRSSRDSSRPVSPTQETHVEQGELPQIS